MMEKLQGLFDSPEIEVIKVDGTRIRGRIDNLRSTQPFSKPAVKIIGVRWPDHQDSLQRHC
jgi:hypothetical protein